MHCFGTRSSSFPESGARLSHADSVYIDVSQTDSPSLESRGQTNAFSRHLSGESINGNQEEFINTNGSESIPTSGSPGPTNGRSNGDRMEFQGAIKWVENSVPFLLLLLSRIMWDHRLGEYIIIRN